MPIPAGQLLGRVALSFSGAGAKATMEDLSAAARAADGTYWFAADERAAIEVLRRDRPQFLEGHRCYSLAEPLGLAADVEIDIEGFAMEDDALWLVGSHSAKRKKPRGGGARALERLATVVMEDARISLARIPIERGAPDLARIATMPRGDGSLLQLLSRDVHLGRFVPDRGRDVIPGKDNGFDVEGLAWYDGRLLVGLRGPVLRGWAFVLELELDVNGNVLAPPADRSYRKHVLDLDGLGVREIVVRGDDVVVLAGPTMSLDGVHRFFRWRPRGDHRDGDDIVEQASGVLEPLFDLPVVAGFDRAEGIAPFDWFAEEDSMLVVYDSPSDARRLDDHTVVADVFALPARK
jgi:hypothetical protein